jgi:LmbE family N-acetylglucosaminyl deacetylase
MPTDRADVPRGLGSPPYQGAALFLFAHQDDEFGVFHRMARCRAQGLRVACAYLTDGATARASSARRNAESLAVLARLAVTEVDFAGDELGIGDAQLPRRLADAARWLQAWLDRFSHIDSLHVPAWEGGHHDHDALHALAVRVAAARGLLARTFQYSLYQAKGLPGPLFRVLAPLPENGPVRASVIAWSERLRFVRLCLCYPSQRASWAGLFPAVACRYLLHGRQSLQPVALARIGERPHAGPLYYEKRRFFTWTEMAQRLAAWRAVDKG